MMEFIIAFAKGLLVCFLLMPYVIYIMRGIGDGDANGLVQDMKVSNIFLRIYMIYYPIAGLAAVIGSLIILGIYSIGKTVTIF